jgi:hypothetical protein
MQNTVKTKLKTWLVLAVLLVLLILVTFVPSKAQSGCNCANFSLVNPDFEQPGVALGGLGFFTPPTIPGWQTTDVNNQIEIWGSGFGGVPAYSGINFAELNANSPSILYQNVATCPGQTYSWQVAHRGRAGTDQARFEVGPPGGPFTTVTLMTDGTSAWGFYSGTYTVPSGQTTTQVRLTAVFAAGGLSVGNFVDNFLFTPDFCTTDNDGDGYSEVQGDCDDADNTVYPGATELCDAKDNNCNGVVDDEIVPPVITCPANIVVGATGGTGANVNFTASATDNCTTPTITYSIAPGSFFPIGTTTVTATAKDARNNSASCNFTVTVNPPAGALNFDGINDFIYVPNITGSVFTLETWIKTTANSLTGTHAYHGNGIIWADVGGGANDFTLAILNNRMAFFDGSGDIVTNGTTILNDGNWHHLAVVRNGVAGNTTIYVDGNAEGSNVANNVAVNQNPNIGIGANTLDVRYFNGSIDEVRIWNRALCQGELQNNMSCEFSGPQPGLASYYRFNQGYINTNNSSVNVLMDASGNSHNGNLNNFALNGATSNWVAGHVSGICSAFIPPTASISAGGPTTFCAGGSVTLTANSGQAYKWQRNGTDIPGATSQSYDATASGNYTAIVTVNGCSSAASASISVTVNPLPVVTATSTSPVCERDTLKLFSAPPNGSYSWSGPNSFTSTDQHPVMLNATTAMAGSYTVTVTDANNCSASASTPVVVNTLPTVTATSNSPVCEGGTLNLGTNSNTAYIWNGPNGFSSTNQNPSISNVTTAATGTYFIKATGANGCRDAASVNVVINPNPAIPTVTAGGPTTFCNGGAVTLTASSIVGGNVPPSTTAVLKGTASTNPLTTVCDCPAGWVAVGYTGRTGTWMDQFRLICRQLNSDGTLGAATALTATNGTSFGGSARPNFFLPSNNVMVGAKIDVFFPGAVSYITGITGYGQTVSYIDGNGSNSTGASVAGTMTGAVSGTAGTVYVPDGNVITGMLADNTTGFSSAVAFRYKPISSFLATVAWSTSAITNSINVNTSGSYTVTVTDGNGCSSTSAPTVVTVNPVPVAFNVTGGGEICAGSAGTPVGLSGSEANVNYQLKRNGSNVGGLVAGTGSAISFGNQTVAGNYTVLATHTNGNCTNNMTGSVTIIVNVAPVFTACPANINVTAAANKCYQQVSYTATANGIPAPGISYSFSGATTGSGSGTGSNSIFNVGVTTVTITATNVCGAPTCTFTITVTDNENPVISCPADITHTADAGECGYTVNVGTATATDNCAVASVTGTRNDAAALNAPYPVGTTTILWKAIDIHGNSSTCTQTIVVTDDENPVITCPANINHTADAGYCSYTVNPGIATATDNCAVASVVGTRSDAAALNDPYPVGTTTILWKATDIHGNSSTCTQTIVVTDDENPVITCPADVNHTADAGVCSYSFTPAATATDNCAVASVVGTRSDAAALNAPYPVGTTTILWKATDIHGNSSTCTQTIVVTDDENPVITCPADVNHTADAGYCSYSFTPAATATDNCAVAGIAGTRSDAAALNAPYPVGTTTILWKATDIHGNSSTCTQTIIVADNENPVITCPADVNHTADAGECGYTFTVTAATATDNCAIASVTGTRSDAAALNAPYPVGTTTILWKATDIHGNSSTCTQTIVVTDNENPAALCQNYTLNLSGGTGTVTPANIDNGSTDNCAIATMTVTPNTFTCANAGNNTVTLTVTDIHGNVSTCTATVLVQYQPTCTISVTPSNSTFTGGVATNIYLGYGPQSATITANPTGGSGFTYSWSGPTSKLSCTNCQSPVFTPTAGGTYTYTVTATNSNGCSTTCTVTFCVKDIRDGISNNPNSQKVFICHVPPGNPGNAHTLSISINAVPSHLGLHAGDRLGRCDQTCGAAAKGQHTEELLTIGEMKVYPNPTTGVFVADMPEGVKGGEATIMDMTGRIIEQKRFMPETELRFDLGHVAQGVYMLQVVNGGQTYRARVVIQN